MPSNEIIQKILLHNQEREENSLSKYACKSVDAKRFDPTREKVPDWENVRSRFFHDTDKILHSQTYTRYIDKTQVFYLFDNDHITHRVLHVQFVAKIARTLARCLKLNEDLVEAISLGHDVGHAPFGHDGEKALNAICAKYNIGAFMHNAQSVRWLIKLENGGKGLNLCLQTLDGILAHNGEDWRQKLSPQPNKDWDIFFDEYSRCMKEPEFSKSLKPMTLEGCLARICDVIAYVGRDIEDAITLRLLERDDLPEKAVEVLGRTNSSIINTIALDLIENSYDQSYISLSPKVFAALDELIHFNYEKIYTNPLAHEQDDKIRRLFDGIYQESLSLLQNHLASPKPQSSEVPGVVRFYNKRLLAYEHNPPERAVIDYIAGMTDDFFLNKAREVFIPTGFGLKVP